MRLEIEALQERQRVRIHRPVRLRSRRISSELALSNLVQDRFTENGPRRIAGTEKQHVVRTIRRYFPHGFPRQQQAVLAQQEFCAAASTAGSSSPYVVASPKVKKASQRTPDGSLTHALFDCA